MNKRPKFPKKKPYYIDIDDTILQDNGEGEPFPYCIDVIKQWIKNGHEVNLWSARGKLWCEWVNKNILKIDGINAYLTKPYPTGTFDDKPERLATRLQNVVKITDENDWYKLGMKYCRWKKK